MTSNPPPGPPQGEPGAGQQPGGYQPPPPNYGQPGPAQPPPPPPNYGQPGGQGYQYPPAQQYGQYGGPQGQQQPARKPSFDFSTVNPLDWAIMAAGVVALIFSFFSYYDYSYKGQFSQACGSDCSRSTGAWSGFFGWFAVLLALAAAALVAVSVFLPTVKLPLPARLMSLGGFALAVICTLLALPFVPNYQGASGALYDRFIDEGHGFSYWIVLIVLIAGGVLSYLRYTQTGGDLAALFSGGSKKQATGVYGPPQNNPPQQGYQQQAPTGYQSPPSQQQPPQQQGYQPQPPPGGYQPPAGYQPPPQPGYQPPPPQQPGYQPPPQQGEQQQPPPQPPTQG